MFYGTFPAGSPLRKRFVELETKERFEAAVWMNDAFGQQWLAIHTEEEWTGQQAIKGLQKLCRFWKNPFGHVVAEGAGDPYGA